MALTQLTQLTGQSGISTTIDYKMSDLVVDTISVAGTITYNDVTSVDSIGIITARTGIKVLAGGIDVTGNSEFSAVVDIAGDLAIADTIRHIGDSNTKIRFPANDTVSVETAGQQNVQVNGTRTLLKSPSGTDTTVRLQHQGNSGYGDIILDRQVNAFIIDNDPSNASNNQSYFSVKNKGATNFYIKHDGKVGIGTDVPETRLHVSDGHTASANDFDSNVVLAISKNTTTSSWAGLALNSGNAAGSFIHFGDTDDSNVGRLDYSHGDNSFKFFTNGSSDERLRINSSGHISLGGSNVTDVNMITVNGTGATQNVGIVFNKTNSPARAYGINVHNTTGDLIFFDYTANAERVRITSAGKLVVATNINQTVAFDYAGVYFTSDNSTTADGLFLNNTAANTGDNVSLSFSTDSGNRKKSALSHVDTGNYGRGDLVFSIDPDADSGELDIVAHEKLRIKSDGKVGIGSDSPTSQLDIKRANVTGTYPDGNAIPSGASIYNDGGDIFTGRLFLQGWQRGANSDFLTGMNNEGNVLVMYNYGSSKYMQKWQKSGANELYWSGSSGVGKKLETTSTGAKVTGQLDLESAGSYIKSNQLKFNPSGHAYIDHGVVAKDISFRLSKSSSLDQTMLQMDADGEITKFHKVISVGLQGGNDTAVVGGGAGIGAYLQLNHATSGANTKLMGNNDSWLNANHGNLGIGTANPHSRKLHVLGTGRPVEIGSDNATNIVKLYASTTGRSTYNGLDIIVNTTNGSSLAAYGGYLDFKTSSSNGSDATSRLHLTKDGALLVNTTTPYYASGDMQHEIKGNNNRAYTPQLMTSHPHLLLNNSDTTDNCFTGIGFRAGSGDASIGYVYRGSANNADFVINTDGNGNGVERLRVFNGGSVLIGALANEAAGGSSSSGSARLVIDCEGLNVFDGVGAASNYGLVFANDPTTNKANGIGFFNDGGTAAGGYIVHQDKGSNNIGDLVFGTASSTDSPTEKLRITSDGKVGINTNDPDGILHVKHTGENNVYIEGSASTLGARLILKNVNSTAHSYNDLSFEDAGGQSTSIVRGYNTDNATNEGYLAFFCRPNGGIPTKWMDITATGELRTFVSTGKESHNYCKYFQWGGYAQCSATWSVSIPNLTQGNIYRIMAYHSHHSMSYGSYIEGVYGAYSAHSGLQIDTDFYNVTSSAGGSWDVTRGGTNGDPIVITHTGGTYNGYGHWFIWVLSGTT